MHASELVELAALIAYQAPALVRSCPRLSDTSMEQYWTSSKCRLDRWARAVKAFNTQIQQPELDSWRREPLWQQIEPTLEEILGSEVLTRVWTALCGAIDQAGDDQQAEPVARSIYIGHLEARHRALNLMVYGEGLGAQRALSLNRLRRRAERWTDLLMAYLVDVYDIDQLAFEPRRARDFADDFRSERRQRGTEQGRALMLASLRTAFAQALAPESPNADLNEQIAVSILACFGPEAFDSTGRFQSLWQLRLSNATSDTMGMLDELLRADDNATSSPRLADRFRLPDDRRTM